jgi:peptidoglycan/LPS O-acetylase OafA/YrhL
MGEPAAGGANLPSLTGLRWLAALLVFGHHSSAADYFGQGGMRQVVDMVFAQAAVGVSFFFILSGFVLMWSGSRAPARTFWYRRFARVYPLHAVTALLALGFLLAWRPHEAPALAGLANVTLIHAWIPDEAFYQSLNTVSWTLSCEAFFYLTFPLICRAVIRLAVRGAAVLAGGALVLIVGAPLLTETLAGVESADWIFHWTPIGRSPEFLLGVALARLVQLTRHRLVEHTRVLWLAAIAAAAVGYVNAYQAPPVMRYAACTALGFGLILIAAASSDLRGDKLLWSRPAAVKLGELSFGFYLVHVLVIRAFDELGSGPPVTLGALAFAVSLLVAWLLHESVEKPARIALLARG